jgi:hypothetical protein
MVKTGRSRVARLVLLGCALAVGSGSFGASAATAAPLERLTGPVREATGAVEEVVGGVAPTVQEVTEAVPPPVAEVTEHVTPPVVEATQAVVPPAKEAVETVTQATQEVVAKVPSPAVTTPPKVPAGPATDPSGGGKTVTQTVTHDVEGALGAVTGAVHADRSPVGEGPVGTSAAEGGSARRASVPSEVAGADSTAKAEGNASGGGDGLPGDEFQAPSPDGSIRAPLPRWMAYVWPAIALTGRELAGLLDGLQRAAVRLLPTSAGGPSGSQGVAGVHASHGAWSAGSGSSSSPFAPIPAAIGGFTSHVPGEALAYLAIVAILVAAVFAAVKFEIARRDRGST